MSGRKILMLTGEFTEEYEIFVYQQAMEAVGHTVHVVCPDKKAGDLIKTSLHDFEGDQTYTEKLGHFFTINKTFSEAENQLAQYDAVYCAGGRGPEYIRTDKRVQAIVRHFHETQEADLHDLSRRPDPRGCRWRCARQEGRSARRMRARSDARGRHLHRSFADRGLCRWYDGVGQGLDRSGCIHPRMPESAWHGNSSCRSSERPHSRTRLRTSKPPELAVYCWARGL